MNCTWLIPLYYTSEPTQIDSSLTPKMDVLDTHKYHTDGPPQNSTEQTQHPSTHFDENTNTTSSIIFILSTHPNEKLDNRNQHYTIPSTVPIEEMNQTHNDPKITITPTNDYTPHPFHSVCGLLWFFI